MRKSSQKAGNPNTNAFPPEDGWDPAWVPGHALIKVKGRWVSAGKSTVEQPISAKTLEMVRLARRKRKAA